MWRAQNCRRLSAPLLPCHVALGQPLILPAASLFQSVGWGRPATPPTEDTALHSGEARRARRTGAARGAQRGELGGVASSPWPAAEAREAAAGPHPLLPLLMAEFAMTVASLHWSALETE